MTQIPVFSGDGENTCHVGHLSEQVHDDDRARARRYCLGEGARRNEQRVVTDIGEAGNSTRPDNRGGRGDEGVRWHDNLVARAYPQCGEGEFQGVRTVRDTHGIIGPAVGGPLFLKGSDRRAAYICCAEQAGQIVPLNRGPDFTRHGSQVCKGNGSHRRGCLTSSPALPRNAVPVPARVMSAMGVLAAGGPW